MKNLKGSDLDRMVGIEVYTGVTTDALKNETKTYASLVNVPARIKELPASKETEINQGILYDSVMEVVIRYKEAYEDTRNKLTYKGRVYDVINSREGYERRKWLILKCVYGGKELNR